MNRKIKIASLALMALSMVGVVVAATPQIYSAQKPTSQDGDVVALASNHSDVVDAYDWRTTNSSVTPNPSGGTGGKKK